MNTALSFGILVPLIVIAIIVGIILSIINTFRNKDDKHKSVNTTMNSYFYFIIFITKFMMVGAIAGLLSYIFSELFGLNRSFNTQGEVVTNIITVIIMGMIMVGHTVGLNYYSKKHPSESISRQFNIISLVIYSVLSIIFIITTINDISYSLDNVSQYTARSISAEPLSWTITLIPLWTYFLIKVVTMLDDKEVDEVKSKK